MVAPEALRNEAASTNTLRVPMRRRNFGNGTELEIFDDLPTMSKPNLRSPEKRPEAGQGPVLKSRRYSIVNGQPTGRTRSGSLNSSDPSSKLCSSVNKTRIAIDFLPIGSASIRDRRVNEVPSNIGARDLRQDLDRRRSPRKHEQSQTQQKPRLIRGSDPKVAKGKFSYFSLYSIVILLLTLCISCSKYEIQPSHLPVGRKRK